MTSGMCGRGRVEMWGGAVALGLGMMALGMSTLVAAPVLFVTATPSSGDTTSGSFGHFVSLVGGHRASTTLAPRGGDLWIRYDDGTMRNLTQECGYGVTVGQEITVREPNVHWNGQKAVFSMVVGGTHLTNPPAVYFQLYEITGILQGQTASITKVPGQLANRNNIQPCYATDGSIIFASDEPASRNAAHYPPLDEYESTPSVHGLWRINTDGSNLRILDNCPSGDFTPFVDSFGRVIFTRWDHLKRDQQWDLWVDQLLAGGGSRAKPFTYESETSSTFAEPAYGQEFFPENGRLHPDVAGQNNPTKTPHPYWDQDFVPGTPKQDFNFFFPWMINEDGSDAEFLNHLGRHEMFGFVPKAHDSLPDFFRSGIDIRSMNMIREDPNVPGRYYAIDAAEFGSHGAGRIVRLDAPLGMNADAIPATMVNVSPYLASDWSGGVLTNRFRDPMIRQDGSLWVACAGQTADANKTATNGPAPAPYVLSSNYAFRIRKMVPNGKGFLEPGDYLIPGGINKSVTYDCHAFWPPRQVTYTGPMWELFPVEVVARPIPAPKVEHLETPEKNVLVDELGSEAGIDSLRAWMTDNNLALIIVRDSIKRADKQQPFNLKVADSDHQSTDPGVTPTEVDYMQILHGEYLRTYGGSSTATTPEVGRGRRQIARAIAAALNPPVPTAPPGGVQIAADGSVAAFVPAGRATTWQLTTSAGAPVVRERYWMTMRRGEIRFCHGCHGANTADVHGNPLPTNEAQALRDLMAWWKTESGFVPPVLKGDANNDGSVNVADLTDIYNHLAGLTGPLAGDGDLNNDGSVTGQDADLLRNHLVNGVPLP